MVKLDWILRKLRAYMAKSPKRMAMFTPETTALNCKSRVNIYEGTMKMAYLVFPILY